MSKLLKTGIAFLGLGLAFGALSPGAALKGDFSSYRGFRLGSSLAAVTKEAGEGASLLRVLHSRPALIQELEWRPQGFSQTESVQKVILSFYNGELFRFAVEYDRNQTEGLTGDDLVEAASAMYGSVAPPAAPSTVMPGRYGGEEVLLARWQDSEYRVDLIRSSYGPSFRLVGSLKRLETPAQAASIEAFRLDEQEAPKLAAERDAKDIQTARTKLEKARLVNKPKFRP